jgi:hypothetical protein
MEPKCRIECLPHQPSTRRGVGILSFSSNRQATAKAGYHGLGEKQKWILKAVDWWVSGNLVPKNRGHGWDKKQYGGKYVDCYVFKTSDDDRFYGFICHPLQHDARYEFCVLVLYAVKDQWKTDEQALKICIDMKEDKSVIQALQVIFPDPSGGKKHESQQEIPKNPLDC